MFGFLRSHPRHHAWRRAYARCCAAQHRRFGALTLPFLSYEGVFAYLLAADAGFISSPASDHPLCCRLRKRFDADDMPDADVGQFAAAVGLLLGRIKLDDDVRDDGAFLSRFGRFVLRRRFARAADVFAGLDDQFASRVGTLIDDHLKLEAGAQFSSLQEYCKPTADAFGYVFALLARVVQRPDETEWLRAVGRQVGTALLVFDCATDWDDDVRKGRFNPLENRSAVNAAWLSALDVLVQLSATIRDRCGELSESAQVVRSTFHRVDMQSRRWGRGELRLSQRWGLGRSPGYVIARCDGCDCGGCDACGSGCDGAGCSGCDVCGGDGVAACGGEAPAAAAPAEAAAPCEATCCLVDICCCCGDCAMCDRPGRAKAGDEARAALAGMVGRTETVLKPTGIVSVGGKRFPAKAQEGWIAVGVDVDVLAEDTNGLIVRACAATDQTDGGTGSDADESADG